MFVLGDPRIARLLVVQGRPAASLSWLAGTALHGLVQQRCKSIKALANVKAQLDQRGGTSRDAARAFPAGVWGGGDDIAMRERALVQVLLVGVSAL